MKIYIGALALALLAGCQSEGAMLNTDHLKVYENVLETEKEQPTMYEANSVEEAVESLPFRLRIPTDLPEAYGSFDDVLISDFKDPDDQQDIGIALTASTEGRDKKSIAIFAADFELVDFEQLIKHSNEIKLSGGQKAYYSASSNKEEKDFQSPSVYWMKDGVLHEISHAGSGDNSEQIKELLMDLASQMIQGDSG
ncbi:hypothetical protein N780_03845 [Pontibacillus chungwhensis BH030062]|uniref:Lipoprotein n=1 Tax=Pontibacillus chungwhensis BH030062 TaxID=1385513 RepID=A0A0A2UVV8_9BACI|nr:hypothetical protein [Pontibacillus chungwhensis]KGP90651.1 hypothetical protein N780_03845 [Pontibacillus chungwhensis BH030062]